MKHFHKTEKGLKACYHTCKSILASPSFWVGTTISFPFEHFIWEKLWPFNLLTDWLLK